VLHIVWDWNGTLVDDLPIVVDCVNAALAVIGEPPIDADDYREHFARPVNRFYESLLGLSIAQVYGWLPGCHLTVWLARTRLRGKILSSLASPARHFCSVKK